MESQRIERDSINPRKEKLMDDPLTPSKAAFYSAVIPGLGQAYTRRSWMVPIIYGGLAASAYYYDYNKKEPDKSYDTVFVYCQACNERIDVPVVHKDATNNHYQLVSVPVDLELSVKLDNYKAYCNNCGNTNIIERKRQVPHFEVFTVKLDCSNMNTGMDSWYENNSSKNGDGHPRKF